MQQCSLGCGVQTSHRDPPPQRRHLQGRRGQFGETQPCRHSALGVMARLAVLKGSQVFPNPPAPFSHPAIIAPKTALTPCWEWRGVAALSLSRALAAPNPRTWGRKDDKRLQISPKITGLTKFSDEEPCQ